MGSSATFFVLAVAGISSLAFFLLPGYSGILYLHANDDASQHTRTRTDTCMSRNEWSWLLGTNILLLLPLLDDPHRQDKPTSCSNRIATSQTFQVFLVLNTFWMIMSLDLQEEGWPSARRLVAVIGARSAWPAFCNMTILLFPVQRTSHILQALGLSSLDAIQFHYWAGHATFFWLSVHTVLLSWDYFLVTDSLAEWLSVMLPHRNYYTEGTVNFTGWIGFVALLLLWLASRPWVRHRAFESFYIVHMILTVIFLLFSNLHDYSTMFFVQPAYAGFVTDMMLRRFSDKCTRLMGSSRGASFSDNHRDDDDDDDHGEPGGERVIISATAQGDGPLVSLTFPIPRSWSSLRPLPGSYVYLKCRNVSSWQSHPYSISAVQRDTFTIHVKALGDWSREFVERMKACLMENETQEGLFEEASLLPPMEIEGPYGGSVLPKRLSSHSHCLFLAGGVGLTGILTLARDHIERGTSQSTTTIVWLVRIATEAAVLAPLLDEFGNMSNAAGIIQTHVYLKQGTINSIESLPILTRRSIHVKMDQPGCYHSRQHSFVVILAAIVACTLSLVVARLLCCSRLRPPSPSLDRYSYECSIAIFPSWSSTCVTCRIDSIPSETPLPCCTVLVCYYCFRGLPMLLSFIFVPIMTYLASQSASSLVRMCGRANVSTDYSPAAAIDDNELYLLEFEDDDEHGEEERPVRHTAYFSTDPSATDSAFEHTFACGAVDVATLLSRHIPESSHVAIAVCGPASLLQSVQQEARKGHHAVFSIN